MDEASRGGAGLDLGLSLWKARPHVVRTRMGHWLWLKEKKKILTVFVAWVVYDINCRFSLLYNPSSDIMSLHPSLSFSSHRARRWDRFWWTVTMATSIGVVGGGRAWHHLAMAHSVQWDLAKTSQVGHCCCSFSYLIWFFIYMLIPWEFTVFSTVNTL